MHEIGDQARPTNSQKAMDPKKEEWMQFCDSLFPSNVDLIRIMSLKKYFRFVQRTAKKFMTF